MPSKKFNESLALLAPYQTVAPINVKGIAGLLGMKVWEMPLPETVSGKLFRDERHGGTSGFSIGVNAAEGYVRKRFTVAHEISHFLLHRDKITTELRDDTFYRSSLLSSQEEVEANKLAANILMPYPLIQSLQNQGVRDVAELARRFEVSPISMKIRLGIPVY
jgi:IrrE N-terminal-like domain